MRASLRNLSRPSLSLAKPYDALDIGNWRLGSIFLLAGVSSYGVFGEISASAQDRLRDHGLLLSFAIFGDTRLTDAGLMYVNQEQRVIWGAGLFSDVRSAFWNQYWGRGSRGP